MNRTRGPYVGLYSGRVFHPFDPRPEEVHLQDIAHGLARIGRFNGQTRQFYSVAQHSFFVSRLVPAELALIGLLHDAAEAYICDLVHPVKVMLAEYQAVEQRIEAVIAERFGLPWPWPEDVQAAIKAADLAMCRTEMMQLMSADPAWMPPVEPAPVLVTPWEDWRAEWSFLDRFYELGGEDGPQET